MSQTTKEGQMENLKLILSKNLVLRLFENDIKPDYFNSLNDFKEANGGGYTPKILNASKWKFGFEANVPIAAYPQEVFSFVGPVGLIFGYFITDTNNRLVRWAYRFDDGPYEVLRMGDTIEVIARTRLPVVDNPKKEG
jgi:hypothetical protein